MGGGGLQRGVKTPIIATIHSRMHSRARTRPTLAFKLAWSSPTWPEGNTPGLCAGVSASDHQT